MAPGVISFISIQQILGVANFISRGISMQWTLLSDVPYVPVQRRFSDARLYLIALGFAAGNLLLPMAVHVLPNGGLIFLPLFFFTLIAAYAEGVNAGLLVALASPLLNTAITGMPDMTMLPIVLFKSLFLALGAAVLARRLGRVHLGAIAGLVVTMQALGVLLEWALSGSLSRALHAAGLGIPGMFLMILGGTLLLRWIAGARGKDAAR